MEAFDKNNTGKDLNTIISCQFFFFLSRQTHVPCIMAHIKNETITQQHVPEGLTECFKVQRVKASY